MPHRLRNRSNIDISRVNVFGEEIRASRPKLHMLIKGLDERMMRGVTVVWQDYRSSLYADQVERYWPHGTPVTHRYHIHRRQPAPNMATRLLIRILFRFGL